MRGMCSNDDRRRRAMFANMADRKLYNKIASDVNYDFKLDSAAGRDDGSDPVGRYIRDTYIMQSCFNDKEVAGIIEDFERRPRIKKTKEDLVVGSYDDISDGDKFSIGRSVFVDDAVLVPGSYSSVDLNTSGFGESLGGVQTVSELPSNKYNDMVVVNSVPENDFLTEYAKTITKSPSNDIVIDQDKSDAIKTADDFILKYGASIKPDTAPIGNVMVDDEYKGGLVNLVVRSDGDKLRRMDKVLNLQSRIPETKIDVKEVNDRMTITINGVTKVVDVPLRDLFHHGFNVRTIDKLHDNYRLNENDLSIKERDRVFELFGEGCAKGRDGSEFSRDDDIVKLDSELKRFDASVIYPTNYDGMKNMLELLKAGKI